ncbi:Shedu immune nuclease family protein [Pseudomonas sp. TE3610]
MRMPPAPKPQERKGDIVVRVKPPRVVEGYYRPGKKMATVANVPYGTDVKMLSIDYASAVLTEYPLVTLPRHHDFLQKKYSKVERVSFDIPEDVINVYGRCAATSIQDMLNMLRETVPSGFTHDPDYGLGVASELKVIIEAIEEHSDCVEVFISQEKDTHIDNISKVFYLSLDDYEIARKSIQNIGSLGGKASGEVKEVTTYNLLALRLGRNIREVSVGRSPVRKLITAAAQGKPPLSEKDRDDVVAMMKAHSRQIAEAKPAALVKLQSEIELVTLDVLIKRFEAMLEKRTVESDWQRFFNANKFILTMAFGYPIVVVLEQAAVGGRRLSGEGEKYADFIAKKSSTNNAAVFEIKTPSTPLLNKAAYRGGVYSPAKEFSGALVQVLDQKYRLNTNVAGLKHNDRGLELEVYSVHCCLIVGTTPSGADEQKSFEMFRRNSRDVEIITFDELLHKLKDLYIFLSNND